MADNKDNNIPVVNSNTPEFLKPAAGSILPQWAIIALTVLVGIAAIVMVIPGLPPVVTAIAGGVTGIGAMFGIASPGIRKAVEAPVGQPRVGPPEP